VTFNITMKALYTSIIIVVSLILFSCKTGTTSAEKTESFKVWGNCEKCKKTIEDASTMDGVLEKNWSPESTLMTVKFDTTKVSLDEIERAIAKAGYDNDKYYGDDYAYGKLESCCQYERKPFELK